MELSKQDKNGVRTPKDIERRYNLGKIKTTERRVEELEKDEIIDNHLSLSSTNAVQNKVITSALNNKIEIEQGKGLSENNFTDSDKKSIHTHNNKNVLDGISEQKVNDWDNNLARQFYTIGDIYTTTIKNNPNSLLGYGEWKMILEQEISSNDKNYTYYMWLRIS